MVNSSCIWLFVHFVSQLDDLGGNKKRASLGHRKVETCSRILMFLIKWRWDWSYKMLAYLFGVSEPSATSYVSEVAENFYQNFAGRLFYLPTLSEIEPHIPARFKERFPGVWGIGDGTHWRIGVPENFALQSLTFSVYKWSNTFQLVLCKCALSLVSPVLYSVLFNILIIHLSVISPDGRVIQRSLIYGGKSAEVSHIINQSVLAQNLQGKLFGLFWLLCFFDVFFCSIWLYSWRRWRASARQVLVRWSLLTCSHWIECRVYWAS